jgi:hypothetical protein
MADHDEFDRQLDSALSTYADAGPNLVPRVLQQVSLQTTMRRRHLRWLWAAEPATHFYHLVFVVQELDAAGKLVNSRTYTTSVSTDRNFRGSMRTGSRIPVASGTYATEKDGALTSLQYQYIDIGVNLDISHVIETAGKLAMWLKAEISSVADASDPRTHQPVIRQNRWDAEALIPIGKPTVVFSSDALDSKGSLQVTVTATPLQ